MELWCSLNLSLESFLFEGGWVVLDNVLRSSLVSVALGTSRKCRPRSAAACVLPRATQHELQSNLPMAAIYAGIGGAQERSSSEP